MTTERYYRLKTKDGITTELKNLDAFRPEILTVEKPSYHGVMFESGNMDSEIKARRYQYRRLVMAEIVEYEEV